MTLEVAIERLHDLRLRAVALDDDRQRLEAGEGRIERGLADSTGLRLVADAAQPLVERRLRNRLDGRGLLEREQRQDQQELQRLAEDAGAKESVLLRQWITEAYAKRFGKKKPGEVVAKYNSAEAREAKSKTRKK